MEENKMKWVVFALLIIVAVLIFWGLFFKLAPRIVKEIPEGEVNGLLTILVYGALAYFGGIMIPLAVLIFAIISLTFWD
jgi:hypothetical protein